MGNSTSTIELNGKRYDTRTGHIVPELASRQKQAVEVHSKSKKPESGQVLDGFVRRPAVVHAKPISQPSQNLHISDHQKASVSKTSVKHARKKFEKPKTLMRSSVKKPVIPKNVQERKFSDDLSSRSSRFSRAESIQKSALISRFGGGTSNSITKKEAELPVIAPSFKALSKNVSNELHKLENALQDANAHLHQLDNKVLKKAPLLSRIAFKNKFVNVAAMSFAFLLLIGFFGYQNYTAISMRVAASRAGVNAQLPSYYPAGYGIEGGVKSEPGKVSVGFKSRTDDKRFNVIQQSSNWNSASLLANHVIKESCSTCFQTWQDNGKTVFIYDNSNATWVNGGIWYKVEGNADLTSDQLLRLANSL